MKIYLTSNGEIHGPYSRSSIERFVEDDKVSPDMLSFSKGLTEWKPLFELLNNFEHSKESDQDQNDGEVASLKLQEVEGILEDLPEKESEMNLEYIAETVEKIRSLIVNDEIQFCLDLLRGMQDGREEVCLGILDGVREDYEGALDSPDWIDYESSRLLVLYVALSMLGNCKKAAQLCKRITHVNLSGADIKDLPIEIYRLEFAEKISLNDNELNDLPAGIGSMKRLTTLDLGYNKFKEIPSSLFELSNLQALRMKGNKFKKSQNFWNDLNKLVKLKSLDIGDNSFGNYPEDLSSLISFESMNLSGVSLKKGRLGEMVEGLVSAPSLSELDISDCGISKIPDDMLKLINLKSIDLSGNKLKEVPLKLNQLAKLESISLHGNPVLEQRESESHEEFPIFEEEEENCSNPSFPNWNVPESIELTGRSLELLNEFEESFEYGGIGHIDVIIDSIVEHNDPSLFIELMRGCSLNENGYFMTGCRFPFPSWVECVFVSNDVEEDPSEKWKGQPLSNDDIRSDGTIPNYALVKLIPYLPQNEKIHPSLFIENVKRLFLILPARMPSEIGKFSELEELVIARNDLIFVPSKIGELTKLRSLSINNNLLTELPPTMANLKNLRHLALNENSLHELPDWIGELNELRILDLACNRIKELPSSIGGLKNLKFLGLRNNKLKALPPEIGQLQSLMHLWLGENRIEILPEELYQINKLLVMGLVGNPCIPTNNKWLRGVILSHRPEKINLMAMKSENQRDAYWVLNNALSWNGS